MRLFKAIAMRAAMLALSAAGAVLSGANPSAVLSVDARQSTTEIDSVATAAGGETVRIAVRIDEARYLDTYGFNLSFDPSRLDFIRAYPGMSDQGSANILETRGGISVGFLARRSSRDTSEITVGNGLPGQDSSSSPSGSGLLLIAEFSVKPGARGDAWFGINAVKLLDWRQDLDTAVAVRRARIAVQAPVSLSAAQSGRIGSGGRLEEIILALGNNPRRSGSILLGRVH